jgi:hypothetical protein
MDKGPDLSQKPPDQIRQDIEETRSALTEKIETLENQVKETVRGATCAVETVKQTVEDTVEGVKDKLEGTVETVKETFDLRLQVQRRPWTMFGGSMAAGALTAMLFPSQRSMSRAASYAGAVFRNGPTTDRRRTAFERSAPEPAMSSLGSEASAPSRGTLSELADRFAPEIDKLKGLAIGVALGVARDLIKRQIPPNLAPQVEEIIDSVTDKLGGQRVRGSLLDGPDRGHSR